MKFTNMLAALVLATCALPSYAGLISGGHTLSTGKTVALQGLEWMPLTYTAGLSRLDIEFGFTDRFGNTWGASDWRYATRQETATLLQSLWGGTHYGWHANNSQGALWFKTMFGMLAYDTWAGAQHTDLTYTNAIVQGSDWTYFIYGSVGECSNDEKITCIGELSYFENVNNSLVSTNVVTGIAETVYIPNSGAAAYFPNQDLTAHPYPLMWQNKYKFEHQGSLLVRN
jgi:hypothetical protein